MSKEVAATADAWFLFLLRTRNDRRSTREAIARRKKPNLQFTLILQITVYTFGYIMLLPARS